MLVLRPRAAGEVPTGEGELIGAYQQALARMAVRFAEVNGVGVTLHWRGVPASETALAIAVATWLRERRLAAGQPASVVTSAIRPLALGGVTVVAHAVRLVGQAPTIVWELRPRRGPGERGSSPGRTPPRPVLTAPHGGDPPQDAWVVSGAVGPRPGGVLAGIVRPGHPGPGRR